MKMESLLVYGDGESAVVFVIDSNHRSLSKQKRSERLSDRGPRHSLSLFLLCSAPSQTHTHTEEGENRWSMGYGDKNREGERT